MGICESFFQSFNFQRKEINLLLYALSLLQCDCRFLYFLLGEDDVGVVEDDFCIVGIFL